MKTALLDRERTEKLKQQLESLLAELDRYWIIYLLSDVFEYRVTKIIPQLNALLLHLKSIAYSLSETMPGEYDGLESIDWHQGIRKVDDFYHKAMRRIVRENSLTRGALQRILPDIIRQMQEIDHFLKTVNDSFRFILFAKKELQDYYDNRWNVACRKMEHELNRVPKAHQSAFLVRQAALAQEWLTDHSEYLLSEDSAVAYLEALGRELWYCRRRPDVGHTSEDLLTQVCLLQHYRRLQHLPFTWQDSELGEDEPHNGEKGLEEQKQFVLQNQLPQLQTRLAFCADYLTPGYSMDYLEVMLQSLMESDIQQQVFERMQSANLRVFVHELVGWLFQRGVFGGCSKGELVDALKYNQPSRESRMRYMGNRLKSFPQLDKWLEDYLKAHPQK